MSRARDAVNKFRSGVEPWREVLSGWQIDADSSGNAEVSDEPGYVHVLVDRGEGASSGDVVKAWSRFRPVAGWAVLCGTTRERPWEYSIIAVDDEAMGGAIDGVPVLEHHAETHVLFHPDGGDDMVPAVFEQLYNFSVWPGGGLTVNVANGNYRPGCDLLELEYTNIDLTPYQPASGVRYVHISLSPTGTFEIVPGIVNPAYVEYSDVPTAPTAEHWELAAVRLRSTDTEIVHTQTQWNIVDLRFARLGWYLRLHPDLDSNLLSFDRCHELDLDPQPSGTFFASNPSGTSKPYFRYLEAADVGGRLTLVDTKENLLAITPAVNTFGFATDSLEIMFYDLTNASWQVAPIELNTENDDPDMGIDRFELIGDPIIRNDSSGYYRDWITDKNLSNVRILQNVLTEEGAIRTTVTGTFQVYLNSIWNDVVINFVLREDSDGAYEFEHKPVGFTEWIEIMSGNSDKVDLNGNPIIQQYSSSMGAYQTDVAIDGGAF